MLAVTATKGGLGSGVADVGTDDAARADVTGVGLVSELSPGCGGELAAGGAELASMLSEITVLLTMLPGALCVAPLTACRDS